MNPRFDIAAVRVPELDGHTVLIPGGTGGVGEGVVRTWLRTGAKVIVLTRDIARAAALREMLGADGSRENLYFIEGSYASFSEAEELAERITRDHGQVTDVVASIGGWWAGEGLWNVSDTDWHRYFLELVTAHVSMVRAFLPRLTEGGSYSMVLGGSAFTPVPGSAIISMEQAALRMMNAVVGQESAGRVSMHGLMMGPIATRQRSNVDPGMISADEVGFVTAAYAATIGAQSSEVILRDHADVAAELARINFTPLSAVPLWQEPAVAGSTSGTSPARESERTPAGWPALPGELGGVSVVSGERGYQQLRSTYMKVGNPALVVMASTEEEVQAAVRYAAEVRRTTGERVPFSVRSGGHGISGSSTNDHGIVLDISRLKRVQLIDANNGLVQVQAGARWGDVAGVLAPFDLALTSGNYGDTGVGGLATAGGVGYFARSQGLTLDHVERVRLVSADGAVRWVDAQHEPELFWAVRGGATQAGVAIDFVLQAPTLNSKAGNASILSQEIQYLIEDLPRFTREWGDWIRQAPREAESFLMIQDAGAGRFVARATNVWANDDRTAADATLAAALSVATVMQHDTHAVPYTSIVPTPRSQHSGQQRIIMRDVLVDFCNAELGAAMAESLRHGATLLGELRALGGAVADVSANATAWAGRHQEVLAATWVNPAATPTVDESFEPLRALGTGTYGAYSSDIRPSAANLAWPGETGRRLRAVADQVDPERLFDQGLVLPKEPTVS